MPADAADGERPLWAYAHDVLVKIEQGGVKFIVPPSVRDRYKLY